MTTILRKSGDDYLSEEKWIGQQAMERILNAMELMEPELSVVCRLTDTLKD